MNRFEEVFMDTLVSNGWTENRYSNMQIIVKTELYQSSKGISNGMPLWACPEDALAVEFWDGWIQIVSSKGEKVWESKSNNDWREYKQAGNIISGRPFHDLSCGRAGIQKAIEQLYRIMDEHKLCMCYPTERGFLLVGKYRY